MSTIRLDDIDWTRVSKSSPCRRCQTSDERCMVSDDGRYELCYRANDGTGQERRDTTGSTYYLYRLAGGPTLGIHDPDSKPKKRKPSIKRADPDTLHKVYSYLLTISYTALSETNRADLERRKFPLDEAQRRQYRSRPERNIWAIADGLAGEFGIDTLLSVPGFYRNQKGNLTIAGSPGLLLPARDVEERIIALSCSPDKRDDPDTPKYFWITSAGDKRGNGPSPGAPIHIPLGIERPAKLVRVTEGVLKADLAHVLSGQPTIGVPGVGNWKEALPILKALGAETIRVAYDADYCHNPKVARALHDLVAALWAAGFVVEVEVWDLADAKGIDDLLAAGKTPEVLTGHDVQVLVLDIKQSLSVGQPGAGGGRRGGDDEEKETQAEVLLRLAAVATLFHSADMRTYASVPVGGHVEHHVIRSTSFRRWLTHAFYDDQGKPPSSEALQGTLNVLEARAQYDGPQESVFVRVAGSGATANPTLHLDLCDDQWRAVEVTRAGWRVVDQPPVKFRRAKGMLSLPIPERGGTLDELRGFVNVTDEDWMLWVACLTASFCPSGPYPIQAYNGEQGSAKSTTSRVARRLVDPHVTMLRSEPREVRDLMIAAHSSWCCALDNLSSIPVWLSDALCRLATGGGFATRTLYENEEETHFDAMRPVILNGIEDYAARGDLIDRCVFFHLPRIPEDKRREERPFWEAFDAALPKFLGALLDAVAGGLRELPNVELDRLPRMADFARWGEAVGRALGWPDGAFLKAYEGNRASANEVALEDSPVATAVRKLLVLPNQEWQGTATDLLAKLSEIVGEKGVASKRWPKSPRGLSGSLHRVAPALRTVGIHVDFDRRTSKDRTRQIHITRQPEREGEQPSEASAPSEADGATDITTNPGKNLRPDVAPDANADAKSAPDANAAGAPDANDSSDANAAGGVILRPAPNYIHKPSSANEFCRSEPGPSDGPDRPDANSPLLSDRPAEGRERGKL